MHRQSPLAAIRSAGIITFNASRFCMPETTRAEPSRTRIRTERTTFPLGATSSTFRDSIQGCNSTDHLVGAITGQNIGVRLFSGHRARYLNIYAPGSRPGDEVIHADNLSGNCFSGALPENIDRFQRSQRTSTTKKRRDCPCIP